MKRPENMAISLAECEFVVQEAGRKRAIHEGRKNVHAFVRGVVIGGANAKRYANIRAKYTPATGFVYLYHDNWESLQRARDTPTSAGRGCWSDRSTPLRAGS